MFFRVMIEVFSDVRRICGHYLGSGGVVKHPSNIANLRRPTLLWQKTLIVLLCEDGRYWPSYVRTSTYMGRWRLGLFYR